MIRPHDGPQPSRTLKIANSRTACVSYLFAMTYQACEPAANTDITLSPTWATREEAGDGRAHAAFL